ncbi:MAG TPA: MerR family transcriptional regulator [bacterium]
MNKAVYTRDEFIVKVKIAVQQLQEWERARLIRPVGFTEDAVPFYSEQAVERVTHIRKLLDLGYGLAEIQDIVKKIGLPKGGASHPESQKPVHYLTVGALAEKVGVSPRTIKHWENKKIIVPDMRSEGGFRMYSEGYTYICRLIIDLQLFGYTLEEIKAISDTFRDFLDITKNFEARSKSGLDSKLEAMLCEIQVLLDKMEQFKKGINRWEDLLKKKRKEIANLKNRNRKRPDAAKGKGHA